MRQHRRIKVPLLSPHSLFLTDSPIQHVLTTKTHTRTNCYAQTVTHHVLIHCHATKKISVVIGSTFRFTREIACLRTLYTQQIVRRCCSLLCLVGDAYVRDRQVTVTWLSLLQAFTWVVIVGVCGCFSSPMLRELVFREPQAASSEPLFRTLSSILTRTFASSMSVVFFFLSFGCSCRPVCQPSQWLMPTANGRNRNVELREEPIKWRALGGRRAKMSPKWQFCISHFWKIGVWNYLLLDFYLFTALSGVDRYIMTFKCW